MALAQESDVKPKTQDPVRHYTSTEYRINHIDQLIIGTSQVMQDVFRLIDKLAEVPTPVLITGETGTGKELVAKALHYNGKRHNKEFVPLNCSTMPAGLAESTLFGHTKGAFTGAYQRKQGLFKLADKGTLFLDEIAELPADQQATILRAIDTGEFYEVGGTKVIKAKPRLVYATNRDLQEMVKEGKFREDVYNRLYIIEVKLPPLRERREDIIPTAEYILKQLNNNPRVLDQDYSLTSDAAQLLIEQPWRGNVRELWNALESAVVMGPNDQLPADVLIQYAQLEAPTAKVQNK